MHHLGRCDGSLSLQGSCMLSRMNLRLPLHGNKCSISPSATKYVHPWPCNPYVLWLIVVECTAIEVFCLHVTQTVTFLLSCAGLKFNRWTVGNWIVEQKKRSKTEKKKQNRPFCSVLFSFDRWSQKNVKTYRPEELKIGVLYVFTFSWERLSKENKTEQNWPVLLVGFASFYVQTVLYNLVQAKLLFNRQTKCHTGKNCAQPGNRTHQLVDK